MFRTSSRNNDEEQQGGVKRNDSENGNAKSSAERNSDNGTRPQPPSSPRQYHSTLQDQKSNMSLGHLLMKEGVIANNLADENSFVQLRKLLAEKSSYSADLIFELERCCKAKTNKNETSFGKSEFLKLLTESITTGMTSTEVENLFMVSKAPDEKEQVFVDEFFYAVKGCMNRRRRQTLDRIFSSLDKNDIGCVDAEVIYQCYDAFRHPDVQKKLKSESEVRGEFLRNFDVMESRNMKVYRHDFMNYYSIISSCIPADNDFENLLLDTWNFSGIHSGRSANNSMSLRNCSEVRDEYGRGDQYNGSYYRSDSKQYRGDRFANNDRGGEYDQYADSKPYHTDRDYGRHRDDRLYREDTHNIGDRYNQRDKGNNSLDRPVDRPDGGAANRKLEMEGPLPTRKEDSANSPRAASSPRSLESDIRIPDAQRSVVSRREANSPRSGSGNTPPRRRASPPPYAAANKIPDRDRDISPRRYTNGDRHGEFRSRDEEKDVNSRGPQGFQYDRRGMMAPPKYTANELGGYRSEFPSAEAYLGSSPRGYYDQAFDDRRRRYDEVNRSMMEDESARRFTNDDGDRYAMENENIRRFSDDSNYDFPQNNGMRYGNPETMMMMSRIHNASPLPFSRFNVDTSRAGFNGNESMMSPRGMSTSPRRYY